MTSLLDGLKALGALRLAVLGAVAAAVLAALAFVSLHKPGERMALLYADLDLREAGQIADSLERQHITHQLGGGGSQILVPIDQVSNARLLLARELLPSGGSIGYEIFDRNDGFTANQFQQNMSALRALEGELARTIRSINGVRAARVHLVLPKREAFSRERQDAQASVMLTTAGAGRLDRESTQAVVNLVAAAVPGLRAHNITVVDNRGDVLARAGDSSNAALAAQTTEELRRGIEQRLNRTVEDVLERSLGPGRARAEAAVEVDFDRINESQEKYDPEGQVVRSTQSTTDNNKSSEANPTVSVGNNLPNADAGNAAAGSQQQRQEETTNYEIGKTVRTVTREQAQIRRLSLGVLVDGVEERAADGTMAWRARSAEELDRIDRLVKSAVGFDAKRGDRVEIVNMRFAAEDAAIPAAPAGMFGLPIEKRDLLGLGQTLLIGLVAIAGGLLVLRPMVTRLTTLPGDAPRLGGTAASGAAQALLAGPPGAASGGALIAGGSMAGGSMDGARAGGPIDAAMLGDDSLISMANIEGQLRASSVRRLAELVEKHPEESLSIVRSWMQEEAA